MDPRDKVRVEKTVGSHNDFIIHFGYLTKIFLTKEQLEDLRRDIEAKLNS